MILQLGMVFLRKLYRTVKVYDRWYCLNHPENDLKKCHLEIILEKRISEQQLSLTVVLYIQQNILNTKTQSKVLCERTFERVYNQDMLYTKTCRSVSQYIASIIKNSVISNALYFQHIRRNIEIIDQLNHWNVLWREGIS